MDLEVAAVDPVVIGDHHARELDILVAQRLEYVIELPKHEIEAAQCAALEPGELLLEVWPAASRTCR
ncbi:MAG: hypothetical protein NVSMB51_20390 [Solirubrobacteraceae bacterium]